MATAPKPRTRLSPEARREQLLDTASTVIIEAGLQAFTMEGLARAAGVSAPLVYNYFSSRTELLQDLLTREYQAFVRETLSRVRDADGFEDIVRLSVTSNFDHHAPGNILPILLGQKEIAEAVASERDQHGRQNARFLIQAAAKSFQLDRQQARLVISMSSGASIAAAELAANAGLDRDHAIEMAVTYIMSGIESIARRSP